jgi:uncharacterized membrane protein
MKTTEERLNDLEVKLARVERLVIGLSKKLGVPAEPAPLSDANAAATPLPPAPAPATTPPVMRPWPTRPKPEPRELPITQILGWTGATALVLAMAYLIRLALDTGWLTPERQIALAVLFGFALIGTGLWLRASDRVYASLLPAGGLVVLFLSIYGAHLYYHFIGAQAAAGLVVATCFAALWLGRLFDNELYVLFAVLGSYSAPFLLPALYGTVTDLVIYFAAWSVVYCIYSIWVGNRRAYLLAAYLALLGFHYLWQRIAYLEWQAAFSFQVIHFFIFLSGAAIFSLRHARPMNLSEAIAHLPLLLIFYALQYSLLHRHLPHIAPWIALGSAAVLLLAYLISKKVMGRPLESEKLLVGAYAALALFHAGYMELVPDEYAPWVGLLMLPAAAVYLVTLGKSMSLPVRVLLGIIFVINYLRAVTNADISDVPGHDLLALLYAVELYVAYYFTRRTAELASFDAPVLFAGHIALMGAALQVFDGRLAVSLAWGVIALACLVLSFRFKDKLLGKSSLLLFAASVAKVMLFDLASATPLVRIGSLLILGVTLYLGGWLYKKVDAMEAEA